MSSRSLTVDDGYETFDKNEGGYLGFVRKYLVEFFGDAVFIYIGTMQALAAIEGTSLVAALAHGVTIFVLISAMGHISGGHYNPAVTLGVLISGNIGVVSAFLYVVCQLSGGFVGSLLVRATVSNETFIEELSGGITVPAIGVAPAEAITCEAIMTYLLVITVLLSAVDTDRNIMAALAIGLSITVDILAGGGISGASMNPARSFGPALAYSIFGPSESDHWDMHYVYWAGPFAGAIIAAVLYKLFFAKDGKRWLF